jgi:hypothetical protein
MVSVHCSTPFNVVCLAGCDKVVCVLLLNAGAEKRHRQKVWDLTGMGGSSGGGGGSG